MLGQFRGFGIDEVGFDVLHHPIPKRCRQQFHDRTVNRRWRGKRPAFGRFPPHSFCDVLSQLLADATIGFGLQSGALCDSVGVTGGAITDGKPAGLVGQFFVVTAVGIGDLEGLDQLQIGATIWGVVNPISFYSAAVGDNDE